MKKNTIPDRVESLNLTIKREFNAPIVITDTKLLTQATEQLSQLNKYKDELTKDKEVLTKPINESLKAIRAKYKPTEDMLDEAITSIRKEMSRYQTAIIAEQKKAEKKLEDRVKKGTLNFSMAVKKMEDIKKPEQKINTETGSITFRIQKKFRVTDILKVPRQYLILDETAIRNAQKANVTIEGIEYYEESVPFNSR